jgi:hypothetical protein
MRMEDGGWRIEDRDTATVAASSPSSILYPLFSCAEFMITYPIQFPRWRRKPDRAAPLAAPAPSGPLTVVSVTGVEDGVYRFAFSGAVSLSGGDVSAIEIGIAGDDLWFPASDPVLVSATVIDIGIGSNGFSDWRILTQPVAITQKLAVPMSGAVG